MGGNYTQMFIRCLSQDVDTPAVSTGSILICQSLPHTELAPDRVEFYQGLAELMGKYGVRDPLCTEVQKLSQRDPNHRRAAQLINEIQ